MYEIKPVRSILSNMLSRIHPYQNVDMGKRIYVSRDHHYAFTDWVVALREDRIKMNSTLIHIDAHSDLGKPFPSLPNSFFNYPTVDGAKDYLQRLEQQDLPEGSFIIPAMAIGLVGRMIQIAAPEYSPSNGAIFIELNKLQDGVQINRAPLVKSGEQTPEFTKHSSDVLRIPWELVHMPSLKRTVEGDGQTMILDIDIDFFNGVSDDSLPELSAQLKHLKWDIATISLSPGYLSNQNYPAVLERILAILRG